MIIAIVGVFLAALSTLPTAAALTFKEKRGGADNAEFSATLRNVG
jgi:hypothetical protein